MPGVYPACEHETTREGEIVIARCLLASFLAVILAGCANLGTISRRTDLPNGGQAIHLDPTQRLVYASRDGTLCAEPSPDALQSIAAASSLGLSIPSQGALSTAQGFETSAASFGLRTQSITIMRDELYRICEQSHNGNLSPTAVVQMMQRSQDLAIGVLAIEQLTGAVVAKQVLVTGDANASASANIANTQKQLDRAQATEDQKKDALDKANAAKKAAHDALDKSIAALDAGKKASPPLAQAELDKLAAQQKDDQAAADKADAAATAAEKDYKIAQQATAAIRDNLNAAITAATAAAKGGGRLSGEGTQTTIDKDTVAELAKATTEIVRTVTQKGHLLDACMNLVTDSKVDPTVKSWCDQAIKAYLQRYTAATPSAPPSAPTGSPPPPPPAPAPVAPPPPPPQPFT